MFHFGKIGMTLTFPYQVLARKSTLRELKVIVKSVGPKVATIICDRQGLVWA